MSYPLNLDLDGKRVVIVGGGRVGTRKIKALLHERACISVISPRATEQVKRWADQKLIRWVARNWEREDSTKAFLIVAATDIPEVNRQIAQCASENQLVCVVDQPVLGNVAFPAVLRRGLLIISVSTGGASPAFAKRLRDQIDRELENTFENYLQFLLEFRRCVEKSVVDPKLRIACLHAVLHSQYRQRRLQEKVLNDVPSFVNGIRTELD